MFFSPDGRYLAYDLPMSDTDPNERDLFVIAVDGAREAHVVAPGQDCVMGWSPDGTRLLFASDRMGALGLWALPMADGQAQGAPALVKADIAPAAIGMTKSGGLFTAVEIGG